MIVILGVIIEANLEDFGVVCCMGRLSVKLSVNRFPAKIVNRFKCFVVNNYSEEENISRVNIDFCEDFGRDSAVTAA